MESDGIRRQSIPMKKLNYNMLIKHITYLGISESLYEEHTDNYLFVNSISIENRVNEIIDLVRESVNHYRS